MPVVRLCGFSLFICFLLFFPSIDTPRRFLLLNLYICDENMVSQCQNLLLPLGCISFFVVHCESVVDRGKFVLVDNAEVRTCMHAFGCSVPVGLLPNPHKSLSGSLYHLSYATFNVHPTR